MVSGFTGSAEPLSAAGLSRVANLLQVGPAAVWTVVAVETSGCGFLPDRRPKILFERHIFHRETSGAYDSSAPDVSNKAAGGWGSAGANQYVRLAKAIELNRQAALRSASWGLAQVMGFNATMVGFAEAEAMVAAMMASEDAHLLAMAHFISKSGIANALRTQKWDRFAETYNGPNYQANDYDKKLSEYYAKYSVDPTPNLAVRAAQVYLTYLGDDPGLIDGVLGRKTSDALARVGINPAGDVDETTLMQLKHKL
jgi:hypothetical protein